MKLPSVDALVRAARSSLQRFPSVMFAAALAGFAGVMAVDSPNEEFWFKLMGTASLAIPLFLAVDLYVERKSLGFVPRLIGWLVGASILAAYMVAWYDWSDPLATARWMQSALAFHLMVAFAAYISVDELRGFWRFNWLLLLRAILAALYAHVLYAGIAIALLALDNLFGLDVEGYTYARLYVGIVFVFATWVFLSGVPKKFAELSERTDYPAGLKVFAQYMLLPIVVAYLVILTLYLAKVLITQEWPSGWIGWLVSSVATVGIFTLLLVFPIAERAENRWMRNYARGFYIALLPSIAMLWLAIWKRIDQYGVTEARYFLAVLSIWLAGIAVYYAVTRSRNIKLIPMTLCIAAVITFEGPWGAFGWSHRSQVNRLAGILERNAILQDGAIAPATGSIEFEDRREISAVLHYLVSTHGTGRIADWFGETLAVVDTIGDGIQPSPLAEADQRADLIAGLLGVEYVGQWEAARPGSFGYRVRWENEAIPIAGYDRAWRGDDLHEDSAVVGDDMVVRYDSAAFAVFLTAGGEILAELPLQAILDSADAPRAIPGVRSGVPPHIMRYEIDNSEIRLAAYLARIGGERSEDGIRLWDLTVELYYSLKDEQDE
jgi:hypothetical protein